jgi:hypothetical protein
MGFRIGLGFSNLTSLLALPVLAACAVGCGSGANVGSQSSTPLVIVTQPASQTVPLGQTATFAVTATGTGTLTYQWSQNGTAISGATSASYTTSAVALSNSGDAYTVTVSNSTGQVVSLPAKLTVGARSPKAGDLRFQQVDSIPTALSANSTAGQTGNISIVFSGNHTSSNYVDFVGYPLQLGPADYNCSSTECGWSIDAIGLPTASQLLGISYITGEQNSFSSDLASFLSSGTPYLGVPANTTITSYVGTSLDFPRGTGVYGAAVTYGNNNSPFALQQEVVSAGAIQSTIAADALKSRVITAVTFDDSGMAHLLSYGWQGDTSTLYDATASIIAASDVAATATNLAAQGYIITAFGGDPANGYVMVGTKVQGDKLPRPLVVASGTGTTTTSTGSPKGYAPVGFLHFAGPTDPPGAVSSYTILYEQ